MVNHLTNFGFNKVDFGLRFPWAAVAVVGAVEFVLRKRKSRKKSYTSHVRMTTRQPQVAILK